MAGIQGLRGTGQFTTDFRPKNYRELFTLLEPNGNAPLNALLSMTSSEATDDPEFKNFRDELPARVVADGAATNSATTIAIATTMQELCCSWYTYCELSNKRSNALYCRQYCYSFNS